ncbi:TetR/AcrR family transcriptional regulator [Kineococcus rhizosphaerae]|uniref:TetR/AcrR family transcriptional regulator n=1 Tax=Kineococcus rhizosphaerae TaxID=559628 RepID=UPI000D04E6BF|nr:TetR/AcrR family transcriptional regulator [Kineococcus rhizosphaerae]
MTDARTSPRARPGGGRSGGARATGGTRQRASHSLEAVVGEAVALLDEAGESALTFRALAARLGGGVGSIYWYVSGKDELVDLAGDHVIASVLAATEGCTGAEDPLEDVRAIAVAFFDAVVVRPWLGARFLGNTEQQPNGMLLYERLGQQVVRLGLGPRRSFEAVSAVLGFVVGTAADLGRQSTALGPERDGDLEQHVEHWRALDEEEFPFVHFVLDEFATHDDGEQFRAGLDLLLAGLRLQAGA